MADTDVIGPARPYVCRYVTPESAKKIRKWAGSVGIPTVVENSDIHMTVVYSQTEVDFKSLELDSTPLLVSCEKVEFLGEDGALVLKIKDYPYLAKRHNYFLSMGAESSHDGYVPHITVTYRAPDGFELPDSPEFQIELGPEVLKPIDTSENWREKIKEIQVKESNQTRTGVAPSETSMEDGDWGYEQLKREAPKLYQFLRFDSPVPVDPALVIKAMLSRMPEDQVLATIKRQLAADARKVYSDDYPVREALRVRKKK